MKSSNISIIQFGEGNFLRAFCDSYIQSLGDRKVAIVKPTSRGNLDKFKEQDNLFTVKFIGGDMPDTGGRSSRQNIGINGLKNACQVNCVSKVLSPYEDFDGFLELARLPELHLILSNTTEAGIVYDSQDKLEDMPQNSFPGKLTGFLYERFSFFKGDPEKGLFILPCELIDNNGDKLKEICLKLTGSWGLPMEFTHWLNNSCSFHNTLVDKIVSGFPENPEEYFNELGYRDSLLTVAEAFGLWVIEDRDNKVRPILGDGFDYLKIIYTDDCGPYKMRKVRILNGAHTALAAPALLSGKTYVKEALQDPVISKFLRDTLDLEILPCLEGRVDNPREFSVQVWNRFLNPELNHSLKDICLNSASKWETRCLPTVKDLCNIEGTLSKRLLFSLAAIYTYSKDRSLTESLEKIKDIYRDELSKLSGARELFEEYIERISLGGCYAVMEELISEDDG